MRTVYFDVDTQIDFVLPAGALYAPGAEQILKNVSALNRHASAHKNPLISTTDAHSENDAEFREWPAHCVAGTIGQKKPDCTLLARRLVIPRVETAERIDEFDQIVIEKVHLDCFTNPNLEWLLEALGAERYLVYGVVTEVCVRFAAFGLLERGQTVEIVTDAVKAFDEAKARGVLDEFVAGGGRLTTCQDVLSRA